MEDWSRLSGASHRRLRLAALMVALGALFVGSTWAFGLWEPIADVSGFARSAEAAEERIRGWGAWGVAGSIVLMILHSFIPFPAEILAIANGMVYGPVWGTVITWVGAMLGAYLAFGLARMLGRPFVMTMLGPRHGKALDEWTAHQGAGALFFSRFMPVISFNLINYAAGLTSVSWWTFTWATGLGILPLTFAMVLTGHGVLAGDVWVWLLAAGILGWVLWWQVGKRKTGRS